MIRPPRWVILFRSFAIIVILVLLWFLYMLHKILLRIMASGG